MEREALISEIEAFAAKVGLAPSTACLRGVGNPKLHARLVAGGACNITTAERMRRWMSEYAQSPPSDAASDQRNMEGFV